MVRLLGEERLTKGYSTATDYDGDPVEYNPISFLLWNDAGILAAVMTKIPIRFHPCTCNCSKGRKPILLSLVGTALYRNFQRKRPPFRYEAGTVQSDRFEITDSESTKGYEEIVFARPQPLVQQSLLPHPHAGKPPAHIDAKEHIHALEKAKARRKNIIRASPTRTCSCH